MRRWGFLCCQGVKVFGGGLSVESVVRSEGIELVGEGVDPAVGVVEVVGVEAPCCVELVSLGTVVALDVSVEFGRSGGRFEEVDTAFAAFAFEVGLELGPAIDLYGADREGHVVLELVWAHVHLAMGSQAVKRLSVGRLCPGERGYRPGRCRLGLRVCGPLRGVWRVAVCG